MAKELFRQQLGTRRKVTLSRKHQSLLFYAREKTEYVSLLDVSFTPDRASETWRGQSRERQTDRLPDRLTRATAGRLFVSTPIPPPKAIELGRTS